MHQIKIGLEPNDLLLTLILEIYLYILVWDVSLQSLPEKASVISINLAVQKIIKQADSEKIVKSTEREGCAWVKTSGSWCNIKCREGKVQALMG